MTASEQAAASLYASAAVEHDRIEDATLLAAGGSEVARGSRAARACPGRVADPEEEKPADMLSGFQPLVEGLSLR